MFSDYVVVSDYMTDYSVLKLIYKLRDICICLCIFVRKISQTILALGRGQVFSEAERWHYNSIDYVP